MLRPSRVVAESVADAVCTRLGLDMALRSVDDVAGWLDDPAASLIDAIEAAMTDAGELDLAA